MFVHYISCLIQYFFLSFFFFLVIIPGVLAKSKLENALYPFCNTNADPQLCNVSLSPYKV